MSKSVILGAARTPIGRLGGELSTLDAPTLGGAAIAGALERAQVDPDQVEHLVIGTVLQAGQGPIPSRQAQIKAGVPKEVTSETINKVCASGLRAIALVDVGIRAGELELGVAGGMESMSKAPYLLESGRFGFRLGDGVARDAMLRDGLESAWTGKHMATEASEVAAELEISRADMDRWALRSQQRAARAGEDGYFAQEIVAVSVPSRNGALLVGVDEAPRPDTTLEGLAKLPPLFTADGSHTAGNSPGVNDGAAAVVLSSESWAHANGKEILGEIVTHAQVADEFAYLARTPARAALKALARAGLEPGDIDLWEINEAFASIVVNSIRMLGIDEDRVNVNGGAIALGHPVGASGARIVATLVHELRRRGGGVGCAAICSGGGQGDALIVRV
jgi:acetyl-CoA C-acetyltransferase